MQNEVTPHDKAEFAAFVVAIVIMGMVVAGLVTFATWRDNHTTPPAAQVQP